jgi:hydroxymethylpyrimidine/phosphomethylpyrimidine kinase
VSAPPAVLSIAGYDPSSGAGVTADIKTAAAFGCYAVTCITALTVQSTQGVFACEPVRAEIVRETLIRIHDDFEIAAVRIGMLGSREVAQEVAEFLNREQLTNVVLDPVIRSSSGPALIETQGIEVLRKRLLPLADLITPNIEEAAVLAGVDAPASESTWQEAESQIRECARRLHGIGCRAVLITGGHLSEPVDFLTVRADKLQVTATEQLFRGKYVESRSTHGTGCALAMSIACQLARGSELVGAVREAKAYVQKAIETADPLGEGNGPMNHLYRLPDLTRRRNTRLGAAKVRADASSDVAPEG